jgi:hypothetical protein
MTHQPEMFGTSAVVGVDTNVFVPTLVAVNGARRRVYKRGIKHGTRTPTCWIARDVLPGSLSRGTAC